MAVPITPPPQISTRMASAASRAGSSFRHLPGAGRRQRLDLPARSGVVDQRGEPTLRVFPPAWRSSPTTSPDADRREASLETCPRLRVGAEPLLCPARAPRLGSRRNSGSAGRIAALEGGEARGVHPARRLELPDAADVDLAPDALRSPRREADVQLARRRRGDAVDPAEAKRLVERLLVGDARPCRSRPCGSRRSSQSPSRGSPRAMRAIRRPSEEGRLRSRPVTLRSAGSSALRSTSCVR